jgi:choline kinase
VVVGGYKVDQLVLPEKTELVMNHEYLSNNVLHSLACARNMMEQADTVLVSYSDIIFRSGVVQQLLSDDTGDIAIVVDQSWAERYDGRMLHPLSQAEAAHFDGHARLRKIGKNLLNNEQDCQQWGEFIGMLKFSRQGQQIFWRAFDSVQAELSTESPFQQATHWRQAYVTDLLQELVDRGVEVHCVLIQGGWLEIDTTEDYEAASAFDFSQGAT